MPKKKKLTKAQLEEREEARQIFVKATEVAKKMVDALPPGTPPSVLINAAVVILSNMLRQLTPENRELLHDAICLQLEEFPDIMADLSDDPDDPIYLGSVNTDRDLPN